MFYLSYAYSELRRRKARTIFTALGLAVGIALVVTVSALSTGLDRAQSKVLQPLTGVGTDMTVTRPLKFTSNGGGAFGSLSQSQRNRLRRQRGGSHFGFGNLKPGQKFSRDNFVSSGQLGFPQKNVEKIAALSNVQEAAGSLTLNAIHVSGTIPKNTGTTGSGGGVRGRFGGGPGGGGFGGPRNINFNSRSVTGVDQTKPDVASLTPSQIATGRYFKTPGGRYQAILSSSYANSKGLKVGSHFTLGGKRFHVVGTATAPLGGTSSDIYVELATLQKLAGWKGQVNSVQLRVDSGNVVSATVPKIKKTLSGAQVTTAADLAKRVGGSLTDAKNLASSLGTALEIVGLLAAVLIAMMLTLASVTKRTREIGALRAFGWSKALVIRQISLESLFQGALGGAVGAGLGVAAAAVITAIGWTLKASVADPSTPSRFGGGGFGGGFFGGGGSGSSAISTGSTGVQITAPTDVSLLLLAILIAIAAGMLVGCVGGLRAARLRPADALRNIE